MSVFKEARVVVHGLVQGVGFRYFVIERANALGITGEVRNMPSGTVEIVAQGPQPLLESLLNDVRHGPVGSRVDRVDIAYQPPSIRYSGMKIRR